MVDFMMQHKDYAASYAKSVDGRFKSNRLWQILANELNADGSPNRSMAEWKKVWSDYKVHLKAKMRHNKKNLTGTDGGPSKFKPYTALEETVIDLLHFDTAIEGVANVSGLVMVMVKLILNQLRRMRMKYNN